jgi:hypothetical protein
LLRGINLAGGAGRVPDEYDDATTAYLEGVMFMPERFIRQGKAVFNRAAATQSYLDTQHHHVTFAQMTRTHEADATQIAIIMAPECDAGGRSFKMKIGKGANALSPPLYIAKVTAVHDPGDGDETRQTISWMYFTPTAFTCKESRSIDHQKMAKEGTLKLDRTHGRQDRQVFDADEIILVWEVASRDGRIFPSAQYKQAVNVLDARAVAISLDERDKTAAKDAAETKAAAAAKATKAAKSAASKADKAAKETKRLADQGAAVGEDAHQAKVRKR